MVRPSPSGCGVRSWRILISRRGTLQSAREIFPVRARPTRDRRLSRVFGILNIVFGSFGLLCTPFGLLSLYMPQPAEAPPNPVFDLMKDPTYRTILLVFTVIGVIAGGVLLAAGIGLLRLKPWGRTLSIGYGCYAIVSVVFGVIYNYFYLWKPMLAAAGQANNPQAIGGTIGGVWGNRRLLPGPDLPNSADHFHDAPTSHRGVPAQARGGS